MQPHRNIAGNILIYILGAIFLMGLLIVSLKGSFQEGTGIDPEKTALLVGQVQRYGAELERGVAYVLRNGYSETDIRFAHPNASSAYGDITDIPARQVFAPEGGGVEWRNPPSGIQTTPTPWLFSGNGAIEGVGTTDPCTGYVCKELTAILGNVTKEFCLQMNQKIGVPNTGGNPPKDSGTFDTTTTFAGNFGNGGNIGPASFGFSEGCIEGDSSPSTGTYHYYRVLLAR